MESNVEKVDLDRVDWKSSREFFESLGEALDRMDDKSESYNFTWVGKRKSIVEAGAPINKILRPDIDASKDFDNTKNMLIVGDNLDALKLLQESYLGKIKMIYIDPPYNTGHDFVYHDNFTVKKADFKDDSTDSDGNVIISEDEYEENSKANGRFHSDWLSMMYPRLKLARNLLTDDGVIFISIDDNEQANLKKLCDEVFGEENFINNFLYLHGKGKKDSWSRTAQQYIVAYAKNRADLPEWSDQQLAKGTFTNPDNDSRGPWFSGSISFSEERSNKNNVKYFTIESPSGVSWTRQFMVTRQEMDELLAKNLIYFGPAPDYSNTPRLKIFPTDVNKIIPSNLLSEFDSTRKAQGDLDVLMGIHVFDNPKPASLIEHLIKICCVKNDGIVTDFFSGSGTTGHAVMDLNAEDGGRRQYICVQLNEKTDEKSEAKKAGYDTIDQITAERLRRAGEKIKYEHPDVDIDTGFRVFRVDGSNENEDIRKPLNQINQSDLFGAIDNVKKDRTPLDLLFGVIYASALPFDLKLEARKIGENTVYLYGYLDEGTGLVACFDDNISEETIKEIANLKALTVAFKDSSFADSAAKINLSEHFRIISPDTKVKVL